MLQWCDNFSNYGSSTSGRTKMLDGLVYADIYPDGTKVLPLDPDGLSSGRVLNVDSGPTNSNLADSRLALPTPGDVIGVGFRSYRKTLPSGMGDRPVIMGYRTVANVRLYDLIVEPNGALSLYNASLVLVATTSIPIYTTNSWQHIEMKIDASTGEYEVRREGITVLSGTDTSPPMVSFGILGWTNRQNLFSAEDDNLFMKDLVVWDDLGSYNNDFFGTVSVLTCTVTADVSSSGFTASTGTDLYALLDDVVPDDADYMQAVAAPAEAVFTLADLPNDITSVRGVQTMVRATKNDGGDAKMQVSLKSGSAFDAGADHAITTTPTYWWDISEEDPNTSAAWTPGTFNDASLKIARTL